MNYTDLELEKLWANKEKRREFTTNYKQWGIYTQNHELNLAYYKYDLPDGSELIVKEHMQKNYYCYNEDDKKWSIATKMYLKTGEYFTDNPLNENTVNDHLKKLKKQLIEAKKS